MAASNDLTDFLREWPHKTGRINARRIEGDSGKEKVQVRLDLGVLQMEIEGRPDGIAPDGCKTLLEHHVRRREHYIRQTSTSTGFVLTPEECRGLREEAVQFYHRYVALFSIGDYELVIRDTTHSLLLFDFCHECAAATTDRDILEQFRPHVIMMRTRAEAELAITAQQPKQALAAIDHGLAELKAVFSETNVPDAFEQSTEAQLLRGMRDSLIPKLPASQRVELEERLRAALDAENYELAAILRDELRMLPN